ncbi:hypothetical protein [Natronomonas sp. EA1]|uniref:hypothetical protein n=1 Tax=Natronomonas sp. EA1 TaxID=3421655 RepID=UPI003EBC35F3
MTEDKKTLGEMSHTNPYTNETFGDTQTYNRGQQVAADGGSDPVREGTSMRDVSHEPPKNAPSASRTYMRGEEDGVDADNDVT